MLVFLIFYAGVKLTFVLLFLVSFLCGNVLFSPEMVLHEPVSDPFCQGVGLWPRLNWLVPPSLGQDLKATSTKRPNLHQNTQQQTTEVSKATTCQTNNFLSPKPNPHFWVRPLMSKDYTKLGQVYTCRWVSCVLIYHAYLSWWLSMLI